MNPDVVGAEYWCETADPEAAAAWFLILYKSAPETKVVYDGINSLFAHYYASASPPLPPPDPTTVSNTVMSVIFLPVGGIPETSRFAGFDYYLEIWLPVEPVDIDEHTARVLYMWIRKILNSYYNSLTEHARSWYRGGVLVAICGSEEGPPPTEEIDGRVPEGELWDFARY